MSQRRLRQYLSEYVWASSLVLGIGAQSAGPLPAAPSCPLGAGLGSHLVPSGRGVGRAARFLLSPAASRPSFCLVAFSFPLVVDY